MSTPGQLRKYRVLWSKVRKQLRADGISPEQADARRHQITVQALGYDKSSVDFTNREFDRVIARFIAILEPSNLEAQMRILEQADQRHAKAVTMCREMVAALPQIKAAVNPESYAQNYLDALAKKVRGVAFDDLDEAGLGVIHGILRNRIQSEPEEDGDPF